MKQSRQLIFVYNAKSGFMHGAMDLIHKTASPKTYPCKLCMITYNGATMNKFWKRYVAGLGIPSVFMHRNEFETVYPDQKIKYPSVLLKTGGTLKTVLSADDFNKLRNLGDLINILNERLKNVSNE